LIKIEKYIATKSHIFILGTQRSGTTWLTNIFEASPDTSVFLEPFAPPTRIFPEFPKTNLFIDKGNDDIDYIIQKQMAKRLLKHKSFIPFTSLLFPNLFTIERKIVNAWIKNKLRGLPHHVKSHIKKFYALNYHKMENVFPIYHKYGNPQYWVIKELRLAGKLPAFTKNLSDAHYVVIIRHPTATVNSILNWFEKNRLGELRKDLRDYITDLESQSISKLYKDQIQICKTGNLVKILALYWRISYETIVAELSGNPNLHVIIYEQLVSEPKKIIEQLFHDIGISWSSSIDDYLEFSTTKNIQTNNPISTIRKSIDYKSWINELSKQDTNAIAEIVEDSFLLSFFEPYY